MLSNLTALKAMEEKAKEYNLNVQIFSDHFQSDAKEAGITLLAQTQPNSVLLAGGETTVKVTGNGKGGRNQEVVLAALTHTSSDTVIASIASDGFDNTEHAGAVGDSNTSQKALAQKLDPEEYIRNNDSYTFFEKTGDGIKTGRLPSNVSDLFVVLRK